MRIVTFLPVCLLMFIACNSGGDSARKEKATGPAGPVSELTPEEARSIAKEAYIIGYPIVDNYRIQHSYFVAKDNTEYKNPHNILYNNPRVSTPADKAMQTPNANNPFGNLGLDLRMEPIVLTVPALDLVEIRLPGVPMNRYEGI